MSIRYECDLCDRAAAVEITLEISTPHGALCKTVKKHLCDRHRGLVRDFELSLIPTSQSGEKQDAK